MSAQTKTNLVHVNHGKPLSSKHFGYVYVVQIGELVKIGRTSHPEKRLRTLQTQSGMEISKTWISCEAKNYKKMETELHGKFKNSSAIGEFFNVDFQEVVDVALTMGFLEVTDFDNQVAEKNKEKTIEAICQHISKLIPNEITDINQELFSVASKENGIYTLSNSLGSICVSEMEMAEIYTCRNSFEGCPYAPTEEDCANLDEWSDKNPEMILKAENWLMDRKFLINFDNELSMVA